MQDSLSVWHFSSLVVGSFMRQNAAGGVLDTVGFILIIYTYFRILSRNISARYAENQKYLGYTQKNPQPVYQREKYDGAKKNTSYLYLPGLWTENSYSQRKRTEGRD